MQNFHSVGLRVAEQKPLSAGCKFFFPATVQAVPEQFGLLMFLLMGWILQTTLLQAPKTPVPKYFFSCLLHVAHRGSCMWLLCATEAPGPLHCTADFRLQLIPCPIFLFGFLGLRWLPAHSVCAAVYNTQFQQHRPGRVSMVFIFLFFYWVFFWCFLDGDCLCGPDLCLLEAKSTNRPTV